jgi:hypothetical protein
VRCVADRGGGTRRARLMTDGTASRPWRWWARRRGAGVCGRSGRCAVCGRYHVRGRSITFTSYVGEASREVHEDRAERRAHALHARMHLSCSGWLWLMAGDRQPACGFGSVACGSARQARQTSAIRSSAQAEEVRSDRIDYRPPGWMAACMRWAEFRGPGLANRLQTAIFGDSSGICKTRIQQHQTAAAEFGTFLLKTAMAHMEIRNRDEKTAVGMNLRSHSLDKLRQIVMTGASQT